MVPPESGHPYHQGRMSHAHVPYGPGGPGVLAPQRNGGGGLVRAAFSAAFGVLAIAFAGLALIVVALLAALAGKDALQILPIVVSVPQAREAAAREMVADLEKKDGPLAPGPRAEAVAALADGLADDAVLAQISDAVRSEPEARHFVRNTLAPALQRHAAGTSAEAQRAVATIARQAGSVSPDEPLWDEPDAPGELGSGWWVLAIPVGVALVVAAVLGGVAVLIARRRAATALALTSAAFLTTALLLASEPTFPDWVPRWWQAVAGLGSGITLVGGPAPGWGMAVLGAVPLAGLVWRSARGLQASELATP